MAWVYGLPVRVTSSNRTLHTFGRKRMQAVVWCAEEKSFENFRCGSNEGDDIYICPNVLWISFPAVGVEQVQAVVFYIRTP